MALAHLDDRGEVGDVAAHAEDAVDDYEAGLVLIQAAEDRVQMPGVVVTEAQHLTLRQPAGVVDAGVIRFVDDSHGAAVHQG